VVNMDKQAGTGNLIAQVNKLDTLVSYQEESI